MLAAFVVWMAVTADRPVDYGGIAAVITAAGGLVAAIAAGYVSIANTRRIRTTAASTDRTEKMVKQIDNAVNGKPPGSATMVSQVQDLHNQIPVPVSADDLAVLPLVRRIAADLEALKEQGRKVE